MRHWDLMRHALTSCVATALLRLFGVACALGITVAACSASNASTTVTPGAAVRTQGVGSTLRGWMSPDVKKENNLLYVSCDEVVDIFSVPKYSLVGQITDGIFLPGGLTIDRHRNLYVANLNGTITVYPLGATTPSLTLTDLKGVLDVAVGRNGYVYAGGFGGDIDVYPPGATTPVRQLSNPVLRHRVTGVAIGASNNLYATGLKRAFSDPAVVRFTNARGAGKNLGLTGLDYPAGVIFDDGNLIVSDFRLSKILTYPLGQRSPSGTISVGEPQGSAINRAADEIYVPNDISQVVDVYDYPSGTLVTTIPIVGGSRGAALSPAQAR